MCVLVSNPNLIHYVPKAADKRARVNGFILCAHTVNHSRIVTVAQHTQFFLQSRCVLTLFYVFCKVLIAKTLQFSFHLPSFYFPSPVTLSVFFLFFPGRASVSHNQISNFQSRKQITGDKQIMFNIGPLVNSRTGRNSITGRGAIAKTTGASCGASHAESKLNSSLKYQCLLYTLCRCLTAVYI